MRTLMKTLVGLAFLAVADAGNNDAVKKEIDRLRGNWSFDAGGGEVKLSIYGDESFEINLAGNHINGARKIDQTKKPKQITLTPDNSKAALQGIYKLEGDTLTICFGEKRPTEFKAGKGVSLWTLKRAKPKVK